MENDGFTRELLELELNYYYLYPELFNVDDNFCSLWIVSLWKLLLFIKIRKNFLFFSWIYYKLSFGFRNSLFYGEFGSFRNFKGGKTKQNPNDSENKVSKVSVKRF